MRTRCCSLMACKTNQSPLVYSGLPCCRAKPLGCPSQRTTEAIPGFPRWQSPTPHIHGAAPWKWSLSPCFQGPLPGKGSALHRHHSCLPQSWGGSPAGGSARRDGDTTGMGSKLSRGTDSAQGKHQLMHMHRLCFNWLWLKTFNRDKPHTSLNNRTRDPILFGFTKPVRILMMYEKKPTLFLGSYLSSILVSHGKQVFSISLSKYKQ